MFIYFIKNIRNNRIYIGSTNNFDRRKSEHILCIKKKVHPNKKIQQDLAFFGEEDFDISIVSSIPNISDLWLKAIEEMWISYLYTAFNLYNINRFTTSFIHPVSISKSEKKAFRIVRKVEMLKASEMITIEHNLHLV